MPLFGFKKKKGKGKAKDGQDGAADGAEQNQTSASNDQKGSSTSSPQNGGMDASKVPLQQQQQLHPATAKVPQQYQEQLQQWQQQQEAAMPPQQQQQQQQNQHHIPPLTQQQLQAHHNFPLSYPMSGIGIGVEPEPALSPSHTHMNHNNNYHNNKTNNNKLTTSVVDLPAGDPDMANADVTRDLVKRFISDIWNRGELDLIPLVCSPKMRFNGNTGLDKIGHEGFARMVATIHGALSDYHCEIHSMVVEGNKAFCRLRFSGKHTGDLLGYPPTGRVVSWMGATEFTCINGKILKVWELGDMKTLEEQLQLG